MQAKTYKNKALSALFLMNNVHYLVKAVESSPALAVVGEDWIELHRDQACVPSPYPSPSPSLDLAPSPSPLTTSSPPPPSPSHPTPPPHPPPHFSTPPYN